MPTAITCRTEDRTEVATGAFPAVWLSARGLGPSPLAFGDWSWNNTAVRVTVRTGASVGGFARGMLTELDVTLGEWYAVAGVALATWPIERVRTGGTGSTMPTWAQK